jgi:hypothetical protein
MPPRPVLRNTVIVCGAAALLYGAMYGWLPRGASGISLMHAAEAFRQCSREAPQAIDGFWMPTASQIRAIDPAIPALGRQAPATYPLPGSDILFTRQYIGFTRNQEKLIYVNVVVDDWSVDDHSAEDHLVHAFEAMLPERPLMLCDGGAFAWGVVYDPVRQRFEAPVFNGRG